MVEHTSRTQPVLPRLCFRLEKAVKDERRCEQETRRNDKSCSCRLERNRRDYGVDGRDAGKERDSARRIEPTGMAEKRAGRTAHGHDIPKCQRERPRVVG